MLRVVAGSSVVMTAFALGKHEAQALLQLTSSKHIQNAIQKMDTLKFKEDVSLQDMKEQMNEFKDHIASVLQDPSTVSAADIKLLTDLIAQLDSIFLAELTRQKARDVTEYNTKLSQHVKCTTDKNKRTGTAGDVTKDLRLVSEKREKHKGCRKAQHSFGLFKSDARAVGLATFGNAVGVADSTPVPEIDTLCPKKASWDTDTSFYKNLAMVNHVALCATEQKDFEDIMCAALTAKASTCIAYDECIEAVNLTNEKIVTETECSDRLDVEVVLAKTKCHLLHLSKVFNNENSTSDCDSVTVDDSSLACSLQAVPAVSPCSSEADIASPTLPSPGTTSDCAEWITAEYSSFNASYTQIATCKIEDQCILPTQVGTHDYEGCTDSANYCNFYDRHRDACSDYAEDDAVNNCCACGGGIPAPTPVPPAPTPAPIVVQTVTITEKPAAPSGTRCFSSGGGCSAPFMKKYPMRMYVKLYKLVVDSGMKSWRLILQYGKEPYTPTIDAVGMVAENNTGFAKLADDDINALVGDEGSYDYFKLTSPVEYLSGTGHQPTMVFRTSSPFEDTKKGMGLVGEHCRSDVASDPAVDCSQWTGFRLGRFDNLVGSDNCHRWFTDYSATPHCYNGGW